MLTDCCGLPMSESETETAHLGATSTTTCGTACSVHSRPSRCTIPRSLMLMFPHCQCKLQHGQCGEVLERDMKVYVFARPNQASLRRSPCGMR